MHAIPVIRVSSFRQLIEIGVIRLSLHSCNSEWHGRAKGRRGLAACFAQTLGVTNCHPFTAANVIACLSLIQTKAAVIRNL